jgi:RNA polymerase sigma-70 factor (ECF subfamily)
LSVGVSVDSGIEEAATSIGGPVTRRRGHDLALAARDGDGVAAAAFIGQTRRSVAVRGVVDAANADDLTQETYLRAFRALPAFEGRSSARTWLFGIARRACADHIRVTVRRRRLLSRAATLDPVAGAPTIRPVCSGPPSCSRG